MVMRLRKVKPGQTRATAQQPTRGVASCKNSIFLNQTEVDHGTTNSTTPSHLPTPRASVSARPGGRIRRRDPNHVWQRGRSNGEEQHMTERLPAFDQVPQLGLDDIQNAGTTHSFCLFAAFFILVFHVPAKRACIGLLCLYFATKTSRPNGTPSCRQDGVVGGIRIRQVQNPYVRRCVSRCFESAEAPQSFDT